MKREKFTGRNSRFTHDVSQFLFAMKRNIEPEMLDTLPPDDPRAIRSRRDLRRVNAWMRNHVVMARALQTALGDPAPKQITELGAGDGHFLLRVAKTMTPRRPNVSVTLLDRQRVILPATIASFTSLGWQAEAIVADVFDWPQVSVATEIVIANLVLHHFEDARLADLFRMIAGRARWFIAIEPQRVSCPAFCSRLLWAIGCSSVTRHDAAVSIRAGFSDNELSALWPAGGDWKLTEQRAGPFSHLFVAQNIRQAT
ncbi:MAG: methyltransferase domain-containing protein [Verrucomicrobiota bacterium]